MKFTTSTILIILIGCIGCKSKIDNTPKQSAKFQDSETISVRTTPVTEKIVSHDIVASGMLASKSESRLSFKIGGLIAKIYVKEGDRIQEGQLLATLDLTEINSQVNQAQLGVDKSKRDLDRATRLYRDTVATLEQVQNATTAADIATQNATIARFNQKFAEIRAPRSGVVIKKIMNEGELAGAGTPILFINEATSQDWVLRVGVTDRDWALLKKGTTTNITFDAYPSQVFNGKITKTADVVDPYTGLYEIEVSVSPNGKKMAMGLFAHISIPSPQASKLKIIPIEALVEGNGKSGFVYILQPNGTSVKKQAVTIGHIGQQELGISAGLDGVGEVITDGVSYLTEKTIVKLIPSKQ
jgi:membrane fusion protein, multidrug efflux system